ncbi:hypothetical protein B0H17DRAFT_1213973 [Mycena rosella]|uniref:Uncharacterized protein n=1 Tax=Mycena rosella TaxID=1033263 RepID=A0AAD7CP47_MYCRO|nr:hypothetical protein B0H17DRAFT_1213973 [Mycena rosella]
MRRRGVGAASWGRWIRGGDTRWYARYGLPARGIPLIVGYPGGVVSSATRMRTAEVAPQLEGASRGVAESAS